MPEPGAEVTRRINEKHVEEVLAPRAVSKTVAEVLGIYSVDSREDLPEEFRDNHYAAAPALVFPWRSPTQGTVLQLRPDEPMVNKHGVAVKYVFPAGSEMVLTAHRSVDEVSPDAPVLLCEGTAQSIAAFEYAPEEYAVYGMSGCWNWRKGDTSVAIADLMVVEDRDVVVVLDADAATNLNVYTAGLALKSALDAEGARSVKFVRLAAGKKAGLDDVLANRPAEKRRTYLARLIEQAQAKPADRAPKAKKQPPAPLVASGGRPVIVVNEDRKEVIEQLLGALRKQWDGTELFEFGGVLAQRDGTTIEPVSKDLFGYLTANAARCVAYDAQQNPKDVWPDGQTMGAALSQAKRFAHLDRVSQSPFVRADGSIAQTSGYDAASSTFLVLDERAEAVQVPDEPGEEDVRSAVKLLREEWLGDLFASMDEASQANTLALLLTPLVRGLVPLVPLAVVDGLQPGVGKNLLGDLMSVFATGRLSSPLPFSMDDEENRKVITASFRAGHELFIFDEAHTIEGRNVARAITAPSWEDRILGVSRMGFFPNRITWMALGNNVVVNNDLARRVYRIRIAPKIANPQDRSADEFRHPDIKGWTIEHRPELLAAGLTLVRAWMVGDRKTNPAGRKFGSFEEWGGMVGGILDLADVPGFLGNLTEWRSETDYETRWWGEHVGWLHEKFGTNEFATAQAVDRLRRDPAAAYPPHLDDPEPRTYPRKLGGAYSKINGRVWSGLQLVQTQVTAGHGARWKVVDHREPTQGDPAGDAPSPSPGGSTGRTGSPYQLHTRKNNSSGVAEARTRVSHGDGGGADYLTYPSYPRLAFDGGDPADALGGLLDLAVVVDPPECPDCERPKELVPPANFWYACRHCTPTTFTRS